MTPLAVLLRDLIAAEGPIGVDRYMALALGHPVHGYYMSRDPLGAAGDFTTAPEISQMFGELLGLWAATVWEAIGRPGRIGLIELGPGRGTLLRDALRATRAVPGFLDAVRVHLVERSPVLKASQRMATDGLSLEPSWHENLAEVPTGPTLLIANEFLDALPIRQFVRGERGWHERLVGIDGAGALAFGLAPEPDTHLSVSGEAGEVIEVGAAAADMAREIGRRLASAGGAALLIDYGHVRSARGETLQAVAGHRFVQPLAAPGEADLTAHVDFAAIGRAAAQAGARVHGPVEQGTFLRDLGIETRAARLSSSNPSAAPAVAAALHRLLGHAGMGTLFKVLGLSGPDLPSLPALPDMAARTAP